MPSGIPLLLSSRVLEATPIRRLKADEKGIKVDLNYCPSGWR